MSPDTMKFGSILPCIQAGCGPFAGLLAEFNDTVHCFRLTSSWEICSCSHQSIDVLQKREKRDRSCRCCCSIMGCHCSNLFSEAYPATKETIFWLKQGYKGGRTIELESLVCSSPLPMAEICSKSHSEYGVLKSWLSPNPAYKHFVLSVGTLVIWMAMKWQTGRWALYTVGIFWWGGSFLS